jgi:hypothetical protein
VISQRSLDRLDLADRDRLEAAGARLSARFADATAAMHRQLLGGLFERQGLHRNPAAQTVRLGFFQAAIATRDQLDAKLIPQQLLLEVTSWLADYRRTPIR